MISIVPDSSGSYRFLKAFRFCECKVAPHAATASARAGHQGAGLGHRRHGALPHSCSGIAGGDQGRLQARHAARAQPRHPPRPPARRGQLHRLLDQVRLQGQGGRVGRIHHQLALASGPRRRPHGGQRVRPRLRGRARPPSACLERGGGCPRPQADTANCGRWASQRPAAREAWSEPKLVPGQNGPMRLCAHEAGHPRLPPTRAMSRGVRCIGEGGVVGSRGVPPGVGWFPLVWG